MMITSTSKSTSSRVSRSSAVFSLCTVFLLAVFIVYQCTAVYGKEMLVKTGGKKGSLIIMGKKCVPTMIKTGGKRGKDIIIIGDNSNCGHKQQQTPHYTPQYIPIPVYHQQQHYYPKVEHHYSYHDATAATYGHGGHGGGGDAYHGGDHMSYDQGYGHLLGGGSDDYGGY